MAYFRADYAFDITTVNLNFYYIYATSFSLEIGGNVNVGGVVYPDQYSVTADDVYYAGELGLYGSGFQGDSTGKLTAGTVNLMYEYYDEAEAILWYAEGISLSAVAIYNAALTPSKADDFQFLVEAFSGNDVMDLSDFDDVMTGLGGNDLISGYGGHDVLAGDIGADDLYGDDGDDVLSAHFSVSFDTGTEVDRLFGGAGDDLIFAGYGDIVDGGDGFDTVGLSYVGASQGIINGDTAILRTGQPLAPGGGTIQNVERFSDIQLTQFNDKMVIGDQADPAVVRSWDGDDHLTGQEMSITMYGGNGNDLLVGSTTGDVLYGENGDDKLIGHLGADELWGGTGSDTFYFTQVGATDRIRDFELGADKIDLSDIDADSSTAGNQAFQFIDNAAFTGKAGELRIYDSGNNAYVLALDVNGDRLADQLIELGSVRVGGGDFIL